MLLFFDTETSNLPDFNKRARDPSQPHIVQLAAMLCDELGNPVETYEAIVKPDGWEIPVEVSNIHGITTEIATAKGIPEIEVCRVLFEMIKRAELLVAFNVTFDKFIARIALRRFDLFTDAEDEWWKGLKTFCPMREMTNICKLPAARGGKYKYPKLQEAYFHCFGKKFDNAHDAVADLNACKEIFFWLKNR